MRFIGSYVKENDAAREQSLEKIIAEYTPNEFPCSYDPMTDRTDCLLECPSRYGIGLDCPEDTLHSAERGLSRIHMRQFLALAFSHPDIARGNDLPPDDLSMSDRYVTKLSNPE